MPGTTAQRTALEDVTPQNAILIYVDFTTGLDNFLTTVPGPEFRENVRAYVGIGQAFEMLMALFGGENDYYRPFYPEIDPLRKRVR